MKAKTAIILLAASICLSIGTARAARPSSRNLSRKKTDAVEARKKEIEERKQCEAVARERNRLLTDPAYLYEQRIKGRYALVGEELKPFAESDGGHSLVTVFVSHKVLQVIDAQTILVSRERSSFVRASGRNRSSALEPIFLITDTAGMVDGQNIRFQSYVEHGTYEYTTVLGAKKARHSNKPRP